MNGYPVFNTDNMFNRISSVLQQTFFFIEQSREISGSKGLKNTALLAIISNMRKMCSRSYTNIFL